METIPYDKRTVAVLKTILKQRNLPTIGRKADLIARLRTNDNSMAPEASGSPKKSPIKKKSVKKSPTKKSAKKVVSKRPKKVASPKLKLPMTIYHVKGDYSDQSKFFVSFKSARKYILDQFQDDEFVAEEGLDKILDPEKFAETINQYDPPHLLIEELLP